MTILLQCSIEYSLEYYFDLFIETILNNKILLKERIKNIFNKFNIKSDNTNIIQFFELLNNTNIITFNFDLIKLIDLCSYTISNLDLFKNFIIFKSIKYMFMHEYTNYIYFLSSFLNKDENKKLDVNMSSFLINYINYISNELNTDYYYTRTNESLILFYNNLLDLKKILPNRLLLFITTIWFLYTKHDKPYNIIEITDLYKKIYMETDTKSIIFELQQIDNNKIKYFISNNSSYLSKILFFYNKIKKYFLYDKSFNVLTNQETFISSFLVVL